jgi:hypothetical protein
LKEKQELQARRSIFISVLLGGLGALAAIF